METLQTSQIVTILLEWGFEGAPPHSAPSSDCQAVAPVGLPSYCKAGAVGRGRASENTTNLTTFIMTQLFILNKSSPRLLQVPLATFQSSEYVDFF